MHPLVCHIIIITALICLAWWVLIPSNQTMSNASLLCMKAYMELLKSIRDCSNREHLRYIDTQVADFENKFQGRVFHEVLAMMVNDLGWEIVNRRSEL